MSRVALILALVTLSGGDNVQVEWTELREPWVLTRDVRLITYDDTNTLNLQLDLAPLLRDFNNLIRLVNTTMLEIADNVKIDGQRITIPDNNKLKLNDDKLRQFLDTSLGKIHMHFMSLLETIQNNKKKFLSFLSINFEKNKDSLEQVELFNSDEHFMVTATQEILQTELINMLQTQTNVSQHILVRESRSVSPFNEEVKASDLAYYLGRINNQLGVSGENWDIINNNKEAVEINIKNMFRFESHIAHQINITNKFLRKSAKINKNIISAIYSLAQKELVIQIETEEQSIINQYLINLLAVQNAMESLEDLLTELMSTSQLNQLSVSLFSDVEMRRYLSELSNQTDYESLISEDELYLIYKILPMEITMKGLVINYRIIIPVKEKQEHKENFEILRVMDHYFYHNNEWVTFVDTFEHPLGYNRESGEFYKMNNCVKSTQVILCKPLVYERSQCLNHLLMQEESQEDCKVQRSLAKNFVTEIQKEKYIVGFEQETVVESKCYFEVKSNQRIKTRWDAQSFTAEAKPYVLDLPNNCQSSFNGYLIKTKFENQFVIAEEWQTVNISAELNLNVTIGNWLNVDVLEESQRLQVDWIELMKEFAPNQTKFHFNESEVIYKYVSVFQTVVFTLIFLTIAIFICKPWKRRRQPESKIQTRINQLDVKFQPETEELM